MSAETEEIVIVPYEEAVKRIPEGDSVHTFVNPGAGMLIGADWTRKQVLSAFKKHEVQESGAQARAMKHSLVFWDGERHVFVQTVSA